MKDYASKDWLHAELPAYDCYDVLAYGRRLEAIEYLKARNIWRGQSYCLHRYTNSAGDITTTETMK